MKVTIKGNRVTPDNFRDVIAQLNKDYAKYGIQVRDATCYIRFTDENGNIIRTLDDEGNEAQRFFDFSPRLTVQKSQRTTTKRKIIDDRIEDLFN